MTEELTTCDLACPSSPGVPEEAVGSARSAGMKCEQPIFSALSGGGGVKQTVSSLCGDGASSPAAATSDTESGIFSGECELCVQHETELDWFCGTEQKLICSHCAMGSCHGHVVTPLSNRVTTVRVSLS